MLVSSDRHRSIVVFGDRNEAAQHRLGGVSLVDGQHLVRQQKLQPRIRFQQGVGLFRQHAIDDTYPTLFVRLKVLHPNRGHIRQVGQRAYLNEMCDCDA